MFTTSSATFDHCKIWRSNILLVCWKEKNVILCLHVYITQTSMAVLWIILALTAIQPKHLIFYYCWVFIVNFGVTTKFAWIVEKFYLETFYQLMLFMSSRNCFCRELLAVFWSFFPHSIAALSNIEIASFLRWYILVELHSPAYARRYYGTYDMLENSMMKVRFSSFFTIFLVLSLPVCNFAVFIFLYVVVSVLNSWLVGRMGMKMGFDCGRV